MGTMATYQRFSTRGLAAEERVDLWEDHNANALLPLAVRSRCEVEFEASEDTVQLPNITFARVKASPHVVERTSDHVRQSNVDGYALYFAVAGEAFFYHQDGVHLQQPGTLLVCDSSLPFMRGFAQGLQEYVMTVPRNVVAGFLEPNALREPLVRHFGGTPGSDVHGAEMVRLMARTFAEPLSVELSALASTEERAIGLLQAMLAPDAVRGSDAHFRTAIAWIRQNLRDPSISVATVADAVGVSERTLARAFGEHGATVAKTILDLRLDLAHRILSVPGAPAVRDVALSCGFVSAAHFSRVFRRRFEQAPADLFISVRQSATV